MRNTARSTLALVLQQVLSLALLALATAATECRSVWDERTAWSQEMSTVYNGNGSLVSPTKGPSSRQIISSSTNASPIVVAYGTAPGYNTGDTIEIEGHLVNTN